MAYAEKRGRGPAPWRVKYKIPGGEASRSGFETKQAALAWGRDQEAKVRAGTWTDPAAGEITVSEWIDRWKATQDVGPSTTANREYRIRRFILPYWGTRQLNSLTGEEIAVWEHRLPATEEVSRSTAKDARSLLHTILGDAAAAKPPLIPFNPAGRPRNRGRRTGRTLGRSPQRAWATPLEVLLVAERAALLAGRDDEFTMLVTIGYTGMRWGETIGLERDLLLTGLINVEWQLREVSGRSTGSRRRTTPTAARNTSRSCRSIFPRSSPSSSPPRPGSVQGSDAHAPPSTAAAAGTCSSAPTAATTGTVTTPGGSSARPATDGTRRPRGGRAG